MAEDKKTTKAKDPAKKAPAKKTAESKAIEPTTEIKQTADEKAIALKDRGAKSSTRSTEAKSQSKAAKARSVKNKPKGKTLTITQIGSPIGRQGYQRATLKGLGLNKLHKTRELEDTAAVRGMIEKVRHLVKIEDAA